MSSFIDELVRTEYAENIYYADLFRIREKNWMILGYGKTCAASIASEKDETASFGMDSIAIIRDGDSLLGRFDHGGAHRDNKPRQFEKIDAVAYCLNETETVKAYKPRGDKREIVDSGPEILSLLVATYPYPAAMAPHLFTPAEYAYLSDKRRMTDKFIELTRGSISTKFLLVPYMPTVEEKAALYANFIL